MRSCRCWVTCAGWARRRGHPSFVAVGPVEELLERYRRYLLVERGLAGETVRGYVKIVRPFLAGRVGSGGLDLEHLRAGDVSAFLVGVSRDGRGGSVKLIVTALRSLLGFLQVEGVLEESLSGAVPSVAAWRLAGQPRALEAGEVRRLLAGCDRRTVNGRRDFAIVTLLVWLGLRCGEVAALELDDVDWRAGEILVRGKGNRRERLPLVVDAGQAMAAYVRRGRPSSAQGRCVFVRVRGPAPGAHPARGDPGCVWRRARGRAGSDTRAPAAAHRGERDAQGWCATPRDRPGAAPPSPCEHRDLREGGS